MACDITSGFTLGCRDNSGGIKNIYILGASGSADPVIDSYTPGTEGQITGISGSGAFYKYELTKNTGDLSETPTPSLENGTVFYEQTVNAAFHKLQASIRNQVKVLAQNPNLKIVVETNNGEESPYTGKFFLVGRYRGATLSAGAATTGTTFGDANQYALTFQGLEPEPMDEIVTLDGTLASVLTGITVL